MRRLAVLLVFALTACQTAEAPRPVTAAAAIAAPRPAALSVKDETLKAAASRRIAELGSAYRAVTIEVWGGRVLLMGAVIKPEQRRKAEQTARATDGTMEVLNELVLAEDKALDQFRPDPALEGVLRQHLGLGDNGAAIRVVRGVAFLLGSAAPDQADALKADAGEVEGVKWVVAHFRAP